MAGNTQTKLPQDADSTAIQVLAPGAVAGMVLSASSNRQALPGGSEVVEVACTGNCKFAFGDSTVDASTGTKSVLVTGVYTYKVPSGASFFDAVTVDGSSGRITVTRMI